MKYASDRATSTLARVIETASDLFDHPVLSRLWKQEDMYVKNVPAVAEAIAEAEAQAQEWV